MADRSREPAPVLVTNGDGRSPFVILCDHASNYIPAAYGDLGLSDAERTSHIAWDPGALAVSKRLSIALNAPLVQSTVSRLMIDCNRSLDASNLFWTLSEATRIAANEGLDQAEKALRIDRYYRPYHAAVTALIDARVKARQETVLVCMHSFTPVYNGVARPWAAGLIHGGDAAFARGVFDSLCAKREGLVIGWNEPYSAVDGVTFTLEHHGDVRGLPAVMVEIRNDEIQTAEGEANWARKLTYALEEARKRSKRAGAGGER